MPPPDEWKVPGQPSAINPRAARQSCVQNAPRQNHFPANGGESPRVIGPGSDYGSIRLPMPGHQWPRVHELQRATSGDLDRPSQHHPHQRPGFRPSFPVKSARCPHRGKTPAARKPTGNPSIDQSLPRCSCGDSLSEKSCSTSQGR